MEELDLGWQLIIGKRPTLIVAAHNFEHGRDGKIKFAEWGTGDMVRKLCEEKQCYGLVSTKKQLDPNWYFESQFREKIREIILSKNISLIIDIHGSGMQNSELIYLRANKKFIEKYGERIEDIDTKKFVDNSQLTLAEEWDTQIAAVEIEVREDGRIPYVDVSKYKEAQKIITDFIDNLK